MKLGKLLDTDRILLDMKATEHLPAIIELVDLLTERGDIPKSSYDETLKALEEREALISTGIGSGVAIPHTFSDAIDKVVAIFGRSKEGINFQALDDAPVHLIILFIVPSKDYQLHLR
ncbi:MAG: PTS sugar transporter subunit IIA, partial [Akkermansiaceae bacterium]